MKILTGPRTTLFLFLMLGGAIAALFVPGCRPFPTGGGEDVSPVSAPLSLSGTILAKANLVSPVAARHVPQGIAKLVRAADLGGVVGVAQAEVWIQELPDLPHQWTDASGTYRFFDLPEGTYHVVASFKSAGQVLKVRSEPVVARGTESPPVEMDLTLGLARKIVTGIMRDPAGNPFPAGTVLTLWGEKFEVGEGGTFTTPALPDDVENVDIVVFQPGVPVVEQPKVTVQTFSVDAPTTVEVSVGTGSATLPSIGVSLVVQRNGQPVSVANPISTGDRLELTAALTNIERTFPGLVFEWDAGRGSFSSAPGNADSALWVAPDSPGLATVSVRVTAPDRGMAKVALPLTVERPIQPPTFVVTFDSQGGSAVTSQTVAQGEKAAQPADPTRTGYTFAGWFREAAGTTPWAFPSDTVTQA
ncbi:MAG: InlB B-repeat-containing protein, partial [Candidatus Riflebacteria bacterium]|nr:InlB B-repeat-containing protein [Candidatus Riflebacteria bacterium]